LLLLEIEEHKLFIKNLPGDVKESEIKALSPDIKKVRIKKRAKANPNLKKLKKYVHYTSRYCHHNEIKLNLII
jgi:hypothetical protein